MTAGSHPALKNLVRSVADVVSVQGWAIENGDSLNIHVDLAFREARVGGGVDDLVRFRLALLRADLVAVNPQSEGLEILPQSVERQRASMSVERDVQSAASNASALGISADLTLADKPSLATRLFGGRERFRSRSFSSRAITKSREIEVNHRVDAGGSHRWEMLPAAGSTLSGSGWDAQSSPRFAIKRPTPGRLPRSMIFQVRCLREDLRITDIKIAVDDTEIISIFSPTDRARMAASEAFIKKRLADVGLLSGDLSNPFAEICLLETVVDI